MIVNTPTSSYSVDPAELSRLMGDAREPERFDTKMLPETTLRVAQQGKQRIIVSYRTPQITTIWLEGTEDPLRVPLPGIIIVRKESGPNHSKHELAAYKGNKRPTLDMPLYHVPLPNISTNGICWGNVPVQSTDTNDALPDLALFLGTAFGNHSVESKCKSYAKDVRQLLLALHEKQAKTYPAREMIPIQHRSKPLTLEGWLKND